MTQQDNGGPAFPGPSFTQSGNPNGHAMGMSLRDWFAGNDAGLHEDAGPEYASHFNPDPPPENGDYLGWARWFAKADATLKYIRADAMIAARKVQP